MINQISSKQLFGRWDILPDILKETVASETNSGVVWKTGEDEHLPKEKLAALSKLAGYVLMGFIHPEDLAQEIKEGLELNPQIAQSVADKLNSRIFAPLRNELEKVYAPAVAEPAGAAPRIVEEIKKVSAEPAPAPTIIPVGPEAVSPPPVPLTQPAQPEIRQTGLKPETPVPLPPKSMEQQTAEPGPAPLILHEEAESQPLKPSSEFHLEFADKFKEAAGPKPSTKPALLEIGPEPETKTQPKISRTETPEPRVVHYNEFRTLLEKPEQPKPAPSRTEPTPTRTPAVPVSKKPTIDVEPISPAPPKPPAAPPLPTPPAPPRPPIKSPEEKIIDLGSL